MLNPLEFPPTPLSPSRTRNQRPRRHPSRRVSAPPPSNSANHADARMAFGHEILPFPIHNILANEELMFSMETQVNKLVVTHFPAQLKTFAIFSHH